MKNPIAKLFLALVLAGPILIGTSEPLLAADMSVASSGGRRCPASPVAAPYSSILGSRIPLTPGEQELVMNLKPGQTVQKRIIIAPDPQTGTQNCCKEGDCCCTCQCDPAPCICTCTDEIIVK